MRVLFVKLTSMGDLLHALPAITDAKRHYKDISFDWVIEKNFSEVASFHPAVKKIIRTSHREWRKNFLQSRDQLKQFLKNLRKESYDFVIDGQTNFKSALVTFLSRGVRCGLDKYSAAERIASYAYQKKIFVDKDIHAITRLRLLFSECLDYPFVNDKPDYGILDYSFSKPRFTLPENYLVFVHNASWSSKMWPEAYWRRLISLAERDGYHVLLPWGNSLEKERAIRIASNQPNAKVLSFCNLSEQAYILINSKGAVCSDTGLSHLAASLNVPSITLYGSTSVKRIGTTGLNQIHQVTPFGCKECYLHDCQYNNEKHPEALCMLAIKPEMVWEKFKEL